MASGRATAEEIWNSLVAIKTGANVKALAAELGRGAKTVQGWLVKYGAVGTLEEMQELVQSGETRYIQIMQELFRKKWTGSATFFDWERDEINEIAADLKIKVPKNIGDNIYSIRHGREDLPEAIRGLAPGGKAWILLPNGKSCYRFVLADRAFLDPDLAQEPIKVPDSTPQLVGRYAYSDEQAVLARIRYCRLVDIFLGLASFQLQSHMRTSMAHFNGAQTELDEVYVGIDGQGSQFVIPVQAKGIKERMGVVQIITDYYSCMEKFSRMIPRILAAKTVRVEDVDGFGQVFTIALIEATVGREYNVTKRREQHFKLVPAALISDVELSDYNARFRFS